jgi:hypothetical protein
MGPFKSKVNCPLDDFFHFRIIEKRPQPDPEQTLRLMDGYRFE